jgi:hypothetical protein
MEWRVMTVTFYENTHSTCLLGFIVKRDVSPPPTFVL